MKNIFSCLALLTLLGSTATAQLSTGGLPLTLQEDIKYDYIPVTTAALPDMDKSLKDWNNIPEPKPALVALMTPVGFSFPNSGALYNTENNKRIWKGQLKVEGAAALGLYYDLFHLPKGVKLFLSNADNKQILGGYDAANNDPSGKFANEAVEGGLINIELDIEQGVNMDDIKLHIDRVAVYVSGIEHLKAYHDLHTIDAFDTVFTGRSSICMINAVCPLGNNYTAQRAAAFQVVIPFTLDGQERVGSCSATMINTAANTPANCKQYFLLASHCDFANVIADSGFSQVILRFNYQYDLCDQDPGTILNTQQTMTGAKFVARSILPVNNDGTPDISQFKGDFLLLELNATLPESWGINLAGWNNDPNIPTSNTAPEKFISFHHPAGDVKKVSSAHNILSAAINNPPPTHWLVQQLDSGLVSPGSSGSALFDGKGRVIGVTSLATGQNISAACKFNAKGEDVSQAISNQVLYSKVSYDWDYSVDGNADIRKLKPWLDPNNSGAVTIDAVKSTCAALDNNNGTGIRNNNQLDQAFKVFPNPSANGQVTVQVNLSEPADLQLSLYDIAGKKLNTYVVKNTRTGTLNLDLSKYSNGMYLLQLSDGVNTSSKKIMLRK